MRINKIDSIISFRGNEQGCQPLKSEMIKPVDSKDTFVKSQTSQPNEAMQKLLEEQEKKKAEFDKLINKPQKYNVDVKA